MRVLMLSLDRGLLGTASSGDVLRRHQRYADLAGSLDIIVFANQTFRPVQVSANLRVYPTQSSKFGHFRAALKIAKELARRHDYDLLVTQEFAAPAGQKIKESLRLPWLVNVHSMFFSSAWLGLGPAKWYLFFLIRSAIRTADGFRVNNEAIKNQLLAWGLRVPILIQPTPVEVKKFFVRDKPREKPPIILFVGRLAAEKNLGMLIRAAKRLPEAFRLWIVGEGPEELRLKHLAYGDARIKFLGARSQDELVSVYREADIFALPSNTESFGKVLLEAGAAGCALVATKTAGARAILEDQFSGLLLNVGDEAALAAALQRLLTDRAFCEKLGRGAWKMARKYDADKATDFIVKFWKKIARL